MKKELQEILADYLNDLDEHNSKKSSIEENTEASLHGLWRWLAYHNQEAPQEKEINKP